MPARLLQARTSAGTALTNSTTQTVLDSISLPAYSIQAGKVYHVKGGVIATSTNSTDTLTVVVRMGGTTLTGDILCTSGAVDVANNDVITFDLTISCRSATAIATGFCSVLGAAGTVTARAAFKETATLTTSAAILIECTGTWSVASASNSCRIDSFVVEEIT